MTCENCQCDDEQALQEMWFDTETHERYEGTLCRACVFDGTRTAEGGLYLN